MRARAVRLVALTLALTLAVACNARQTAIEAFLAVSAGAIAANQVPGADGSPVLSIQDTGKILTYSNQALAVLYAQPQGWQATVKTAWAKAEEDLSASVKTRLKAALAVVDAAVGAL